MTQLSSIPVRPGLLARGAGLSALALPAFVLILGSVAAESASAAQAAAAPPFVYQSGPQGSGYYANPAARTATARATVASARRPRTVGPGARDWSTGRRSRLPRPWLQARD
jgi:hypothetical protein